MANTAKTVDVLFDSWIETYEHQQKMLDLVDFEQPDAGSLQNSLNIIHRPVQQHAPIIEGWDLTGLETDIIEESVPLILGLPKNDFVKQRADDMRDLRFWERRGKQSAKRQATELNKTISDVCRTEGSLFYRSDAVSGFDFIAEGQTILNERQAYTMDRHFVVNDRDMLKFASDLAGRQTLKGRPEDAAWKTGQIGSNVAEFDVHTGSFLGNLVGGADPATITTAAVSEKPEGFLVTNGQLSNIDYRVATIAVTATASYNVGDKVIFNNAGTAVQAVGLADKSGTGSPMTFTIIAIPDGTSVTIYPKPIALDDGALTTLELAYANIDTVITSGATMNRLNIDATAKSNIFFDSDAICVLGGTIPANLMAEYDGMKVITHTMSNGQEVYMVYDGNIVDMSFRYRIFTWWGVNMLNPSAAGVAVTF